MFTSKNSLRFAVLLLFPVFSGTLVSVAEAAEVGAEQQAYLKSPNRSAFFRFGSAIAISGDTLVVGSSGENTSAGAVYVYIRSGSTWVEQARLVASDRDNADAFGSFVGISGDTVVVSAGGDDSSGPIGNDSLEDAGAVYVFVRNGTTWTQQAYLKASNPGRLDRFEQVAISGDTIVVGAFQESSNGTPGNTSLPGSGAAYIFVRSGTTWSQQALLKASNAEAGDSFGQAVAIAGNTVVIGADREDGNGTSPTDGSAPLAGAAYVFTRSGSTWTEQAYLKASNAGAGDFFGRSVAISNDTIIVGAAGEQSLGAPSSNDDFSVGAAYIFNRAGTSWTEQAYLKASNANAEDRFGFKVAIQDDVAAVSAVGEASRGAIGDNSAPEAGAVYLFTRQGDNWPLSVYVKATVADEDDFFGSSLALQNNQLFVGATGESSASATNPLDNTARSAGAAYVFVPGSRVIDPPAGQPTPTRPTLALSGKPTITTTRSRIVLKGTAADADGVEFKAGKGGFKPAKGNGQKWKIPLRLTSSRTVVKIRATGTGGRSKVLKIKVTKQ